MGCFHSKTKLTESDLDFLKQHTSYSENEIHDWFKGFRQDCPNGRLTESKFIDMYKIFFPKGNAEKFCDHVFRTFDADRNGYIDFREFLLAIDVTSGKSTEQKLKWAFKMYDIDGNGVIDVSEMTNIVKAIYSMLDTSLDKNMESASDRAHAIFAKMDTNSDGKITLDEFMQGCLMDKELADMLASNQG